MPANADLIWIEDAAREYDRSRKWLKEQVDDGKLSYVEVPGDRRLYLLRSELDALFRPEVKRKDSASS
jgi:hypothetical protein